MRDVLPGIVLAVGARASSNLQCRRIVDQDLAALRGVGIARGESSGESADARFLLEKVGLG